MAAATATGAFTATLISGFAAATFAAGLLSTIFGAGFTATFGGTVLAGAAFGAAALTAAGFDAVGFEAVVFEAVGFEVLLGITLLLFFEDVSVGVARDGFGFAILADEVLAAGLLVMILPPERLPPDDFGAAFNSAARRARSSDFLSFGDDLSPREDLARVLVAPRLVDANAAPAGLELLELLVEPDLVKPLEPDLSLRALVLRVFCDTALRAEPPRPCSLFFTGTRRGRSTGHQQVQLIDVPKIAHFPQKSTVYAPPGRFYRLVQG